MKILTMSTLHQFFSNELHNSYGSGIQPGMRKDSFVYQLLFVFTPRVSQKCGVYIRSKYEVQNKVIVLSQTV